ncbi:MAG: DUF928 domain-containing protein [Cyanobacteria bacterium J06632_3]
MSRLRTTAGLLVLTLSGMGYLGQSITSVQAAPLGIETEQKQVASPQSVSGLSEWSFWPPEGEGAPQRTSSGASRNGCTADSVIPLIPESQYGLTEQENPSILAYVSDADASRELMFSLKSANGYYYETLISIPTEAGIVKVALPDDAPALEAETLYQWSLIVICDNNLRPDSPSLQGWLETAPSFETEAPEAISSLEQAGLYRDQHLWYDMIAMLADLKNQNPDDAAVSQAWNNILTATGLDVATAAPLIN